MLYNAPSPLIVWPLPSFTSQSEQFPSIFSSKVLFYLIICHVTGVQLFLHLGSQNAVCTLSVHEFHLLCKRLVYFSSGWKNLAMLITLTIDIFERERERERERHGWTVKQKNVSGYGAPLWEEHLITHTHTPYSAETHKRVLKHTHYSMTSCRTCVIKTHGKIVLTP